MTKVLIDALGWSDNFSGLTTYCYSIVKELSNVKSEIEFTVLHNVSQFEKNYNTDFTGINVKFVYVGYPLISIKKELYFLFNCLKFSNFDIFYSLSSYLPLILPRAKVISTVHDFKYVDYPELIGWWKSIILKLLIKNSLLRADKVIAISKFTKNVGEKKVKRAIDIQVVYEGPSKFLNAPYYEGHVTDFDYLKDKKFFLCVAEDRPHKNLRILIKSFKKFLSADQNVDIACLVIVGKSVGQLALLCDELEISKNVMLAESVNDVNMKFLYKNAHCLVFPSLYEGFGIPLVDAMYHSLPIITSDRTATCEIAENASILIDPESVEDICGAMQRVYYDTDTHLKLANLANVKRQDYCWSKCALEIISMLKDLK